MFSGMQALMVLYCAAIAATTSTPAAPAATATHTTTGRTVLGYHTWGGSNLRPGGWQHYNQLALTHEVSYMYHSAVKLHSNDSSQRFQPTCGCVAPGGGLPAPDAECAAIRGAKAHGMKLLLSLTECGRMWDAETQTPFYAYCKEWGGSVGWVQGFYDDQQSLALKYEFICSVPGVAINWGFATEPMR